MSELINANGILAGRTRQLAARAATEAAWSSDDSMGFSIVAGEIASLTGKAEQGAKELHACLIEVLTAMSEKDEAVAALSMAIKASLDLAGQFYRSTGAAQGVTSE